MAGIPREAETTRFFINQMVIGLKVLERRRPWASVPIQRVLKAIENYWPEVGDCSGQFGLCNEVILALGLLEESLREEDCEEDVSMVSGYTSKFRRTYSKRPG